MIISDETVQKGLKYLAETDEQLGQLKGHVKGLEHRLKTLKAQVYINAKGNGTDGDRKALAEINSDVVTMYEEYAGAVAEMETIIAKRKTRELGICVWQTSSANSRKGNI